MSSDDCDHEDKSFLVVILAIALIVIVVIVTALRIYCRLRFGTFSLGSDDIHICIAAVFGVVFFLTSLLASSLGGVGRHEDTLSEEENYSKGILIYNATVMYFLTMGFVKLSIIALYIRLSVSLTFRRVAYTLVTFVCISTAVNVLVFLFPCQPVNKAWNLEVPGKCIQIFTFMVASAAINIITDVAVLLLPVQMLWRVRLPPKQKWSVVILFSLGGLACIAGVARLLSLIHLKTDHAHDDLSWNLTWPLISSLVEAGVSLLIANAPALKSFFRQNDQSKILPTGNSSAENLQFPQMLTPSHQPRRHRNYTDEEGFYPVPPPPTPAPYGANCVRDDDQLTLKEMLSAVVVDSDGRARRYR